MLQQIHDASLKILSIVGVRFNHAQAEEIFLRFGFKVDHGKVYFNEVQVLKALETCPAAFTLYGRNAQP